MDPTVVELVIEDAGTHTAPGGELHWLTACVGTSGLDLEAVAARDAALAETLRAYHEASVAFAAAVREGREVGGLLVVRKRLGSWRQGTKNSDLNAQYDALVRSPLGAAVTALCNPRPGDLTEHPQVRVLCDEESGAEAVLRFEGTGEIEEEALGGKVRRCEIEREVRIVVKRARWRDRQVRRLVVVEAHAVELWPDPAPWRELLEQREEHRDRALVPGNAETTR